MWRAMGLRMQPNGRSGGPARTRWSPAAHPAATCPMQSRANLIGGREKRPRNAVQRFEKLLVSGLRVRNVARKTRTISGGGAVSCDPLCASVDANPLVTGGLRTHCIGGCILNVGRHG